MSWKLNEIITSSPSPPPSVTASDSTAAPSPPSCSSQLLNFKRGINRDISAYLTLKDEKYYESFKRFVLVTARGHDCEEILITEVWILQGVPPTEGEGETMVTP